MAKNGTSHSDMIQYLKDKSRNGYDEADDSSMIVSYFPNDTAILIAPYHQVSIFKNVVDLVL